MHILFPLLFGVGAFMFAAAIVEYLLPGLRSKPISSGLPTGTTDANVYHWLLAGGFVCMAVGMWWFAAWLYHAPGAAFVRDWSMLLALLVGAAVAGAAASDALRNKIGASARRIHLVFAAEAFILSLPLTGFLAYQSRHPIAMGALAALYPFATALTWWKWRSDTALQEKVAALTVCVVYIAFSALH